MLEVQKIALERALKTLEVLKEHLSYAVEYDGRVFGNGELKTQKAGYARVKRNLAHPWGTITNYYKPLFKDAKVGDVVVIPWGPYDGNTLARNVSAGCAYMFGKGGVTIHTNNDNRTIEVLIAGSDDTTPAEEQINMFDDGPTAT